MGYKITVSSEGGSVFLSLFAVVNQCIAGSILDSYANVVIAAFTEAAVMIAALQFREAIRGADMRIHFADQVISFIGPADVKDADRAIFFSISLVVVNEGPKVGTITNLKLEMMTPDPELRIKRATGQEDAYLFNFRFEMEEGTNASMPRPLREGQLIRSGQGSMRHCQDESRARRFVSSDCRSAFQPSED